MQSLKSLGTRQRIVLIGTLICLIAIAGSYLGDKVYSERIDDLQKIESAIAEAQELARAKDKSLLIYFKSKWCAACERTERETLADADVKRVLDHHFVMVSIQAPWNQPMDGVFKKYDVRMYPTLAFVDTDGNLLERHVGFANKLQLLPKAMGATTGTSAVDRALETLENEGESNPWSRQALAQAYMDLARYPDSLREYQWCLDEGIRFAPSYRHVRNTVIPWIGTLSRSYPPAKEFLRERHDRAKDTLVEGLAEPVRVLEIATDLMYLTGQLGKSSEVAKLYHDLKEKQERRTEAAAVLALGIALDSEWRIELDSSDYSLLEEAVGMIFEDHARLTKQPSNEGPYDSTGGRYVEFLSTNRLLPIYETYLRANMTEKASILAHELLQLTDVPYAYGMLARAGLRSENSTFDHIEWARKNVGATPRIWSNLITLAKLLARHDQRNEAIALLEERLESLDSSSNIRQAADLKKTIRSLQRANST